VTFDLDQRSADGSRVDVRRCIAHGRERNLTIVNDRRQDSRMVVQLYCFTNCRTRSTGMASALPFAERTLVAWNNEL
jgi:hypothetical protein